MSLTPIRENVSTPNRGPLNTTLDESASRLQLSEASPSSSTGRSQHLDLSSVLHTSADKLLMAGATDHSTLGVDTTEGWSVPKSGGAGFKESTLDQTLPRDHPIWLLAEEINEMDPFGEDLYQQILVPGGVVPTLPKEMAAPQQLPRQGTKPGICSGLAYCLPLPSLTLTAPCDELDGTIPQGLVDDEEDIEDESTAMEVDCIDTTAISVSEEIEVLEIEEQLTDVQAVQKLRMSSSTTLTATSTAGSLNTHLPPAIALSHPPRSCQSSTMSRASRRLYHPPIKQNSAFLVVPELQLNCTQEDWDEIEAIVAEQQRRFSLFGPAGQPSSHSPCGEVALPGGDASGYSSFLSQITSSIVQEIELHSSKRTHHPQEDGRPDSTAFGSGAAGATGSNDWMDTGMLMEGLHSASSFSGANTPNATPSPVPLEPELIQGHNFAGWNGTLGTSNVAGQLRARAITPTQTPQATPEQSPEPRHIQIPAPIARPPVFQLSACSLEPMTENPSRSSPPAILPSTSTFSAPVMRALDARVMVAPTVEPERSATFLQLVTPPPQLLPLPLSRTRRSPPRASSKISAAAMLPATMPKGASASPEREPDVKARPPSLKDHGVALTQHQPTPTSNSAACTFLSPVSSPPPKQLEKETVLASIVPVHASAPVQTVESLKQPDQVSSTTPLDVVNPNDVAAPIVSDERVPQEGQKEKDLTEPEPRILAQSCSTSNYSSSRSSLVSCNTNPTATDTPLQDELPEPEPEVPPPPTPSDSPTPRHSPSPVDPFAEFVQQSREESEPKPRESVPQPTPYSDIPPPATEPSPSPRSMSKRHRSSASQRKGSCSKSQPNTRSTSCASRESDSNNPLLLLGAYGDLDDYDPLIPTTTIAAKKTKKVAGAVPKKTLNPLLDRVSGCTDEVRAVALGVAPIVREPNPVQAPSSGSLDRQLLGWSEHQNRWLEDVLSGKSDNTSTRGMRRPSQKLSQIFEKWLADGPDKKDPANSSAPTDDLPPPPAIVGADSLFSPAKPVPVVQPKSWPERHDTSLVSDQGRQHQSHPAGAPLGFLSPPRVTSAGALHETWTPNGTTRVAMAYAPPVTKSMPLDHLL
jgi:hypothetical protein